VKRVRQVSRRRRAGWRAAVLLSCGLATLASAVASPPPDDETYRVTATVEERRLGLQDSLELQVQVDGTGFSSIDPPELRDLDGFDLLDGPRRVQRQSIVNGRFSATIQFIWTLGPARVGYLEIPPLSVTVDGKVHRTTPIRIQVVAGSVGRKVPTTDRSGRRQDAEGDILLLAEVDRERVYVGQQISFTLRLLTQLRIRGLAYQKRADFSGFWTEREFDHVDDSPGRIDGTQVMHEDRAFNEYLLARLVLFPTASGEVVIDPINLQMRVRSNRADPFQSFFFDREQTILRRTEPIRITVLPIPAEGRPESFTGAVGDFRLEVETDRSESLVNEAVALRVTVSGDGNIRAAGEPTLPPLGDFRPFDPTLEEEHGFEAGVFRGRRTWEYVLVPLAPGDQSIAPIRFSYFDPEAQRYRTLRSEPIGLRIARGEGPELPQAAGLTRRDVTAVRRDIHFIKLPDGELRDRSAPFHRSGGYLALLAMPMFLNAALLAWRIRSDRLQADVGRRRALGARRAFRRALREAQGSGASGAELSAALSRALTGLLADRFNLAAAGLTRDRIRGVLQGAAVDAELSREVEEILDACDAARFTPGGEEAATMSRLLERTAAAGRRLEGLR